MQAKHCKCKIENRLVYQRKDTRLRILQAYWHAKIEELEGEIPELSSVELASQPQVAGADWPEPVSTEVAGFRGLLAPGGRRQALLVLTVVSDWPSFYIRLTSAIRRLSCKKLAGFRERKSTREAFLSAGAFASISSGSHYSIERKHWDKNMGSCSRLGTTCLGRSTRIDEYADTCVAEVDFPRERDFKNVVKIFFINCFTSVVSCREKILDLSRSFGLFSYRRAERSDAVFCADLSLAEE